ncbi:hypothetical protein ACLOJK_034273 [Asimina triloba]
MPQMGGSHGCHRCHHRRHHRLPEPTPSPPHKPPVSTSPVVDRSPDVVNVAIEAKLATVEPTMDGPPSLQSEPFITTATASTFPIRRGRKPTGHDSRFDLIIEEHKDDAKHFLLRPHLAVRFSQTHLSSFSVTSELSTTWVNRPIIHGPRSLDPCRPSPTSITHDHRARPSAHRDARCCSQAPPRSPVVTSLACHRLVCPPPFGANCSPFSQQQRDTSRANHADGRHHPH